MSDRWLGLAAFVYYANEYKFKFHKDGDTRLIFWLSNGKYHSFNITITPELQECGFVYTTDKDLIKVFKKDHELITSQCKKWGPLIDKPHCTLEESKKGTISPVIDASTGETVDCKYSSVSIKLVEDHK